MHPFPQAMPHPAMAPAKVHERRSPVSTTPAIPATSYRHSALCTGLGSLVALIAAIGLVVALAPRSAGASQGDEFVIAGWGGLDPLTQGFGSGIYAPESDTTQAGLTYRSAASCYLNLLIGGIGRNDFMSSDPHFDLTTAANLGLRLILGSSHRPFDTSSFSQSERDAILGYHVGGDECLFDDFTVCDATLVRDSPDNWPAYRLDPPGAILYANEIHTCHYTRWRALRPANQWPDVSSSTFYIWSDYASSLWYQGHFALFDRYEEAASPGTYWTMGFVDGEAWGGSGYLDPQEASLRAMAFIPVAYGAKGVVWTAWSKAFESSRWNGGPELPGWELHRSVTQAGTIANTPYFWLQRLNHYLRDVVGPVVMRCDRVHTLHKRASLSSDPEPWIPADSRNLAGPDKLFFKSPDDIPEKIMVEVLHPKVAAPGDPEGTYYLLVVNTLLEPNSGTLQVRGTGSYDVGAAPREAGYTGGAQFAPLTTTFALEGGETLTRFDVALEGGEGRVYKLVPSGTPSDLATLVYPVGGEAWTAGQSVTLQWQGVSSNVRVRLRVDAPRPEAPSGSYLDLTPSPISGTSLQVSVPQVSTGRGRIEVIGDAPSGAPIDLLQTTPLRIASGLDRTVTSTWTVNGNAGRHSSMAVKDASHVGLLYLGSGALQAKLWSDAGASDAVVNDFTSFTHRQFGVAPSLAFGPDGVAHAAYVTLFTGSATDSVMQPSTTQYVRYARKDPAGWSFKTVAEVGAMYGDCSIALDASGLPWIAYNRGNVGGYRLGVKHLEADGSWSDYGPYGAFPAHDAHIVVDGTGTPWLSLVDHNRRMLIAMFDSTERRFYGQWAALGVVGPTALSVGPDGVPEIAYTTAGTTAGFHRLFFKRMVLTEETWTYDFVPEQIDNSPVAVTGLSMALDGQKSCVAYTANGVLREAVRNAPQAWSVSDVDRSHDAQGPVGYGVTSSGDRWYSFWDGTAQNLRIDRHHPDNGSGGGGDIDPPPMLPAISLHNANPLSIHGTLLFSLRFARPALLSLDLFDVSGRRVASRTPERMAAGERSVQWRPGRVVPGMYFVRAGIDGRTLLNHRIVLLP